MNILSWLHVFIFISFRANIIGLKQPHCLSIKIACFSNGLSNMAQRFFVELSPITEFANVVS